MRNSGTLKQKEEGDITHSAGPVKRARAISQPNLMVSSNVQTLMKIFNRQIARTCCVRPANGSAILAGPRFQSWTQEGDRHLELFDKTEAIQRS
jgi:hypothetical protein